MVEYKTPGLRFIVTSACNYNCIYCHNEWEPKKNPNNKIDIELLNKLISSAKELGGEEIDITGGEPLLEIDRVKEILKIAKKNNLRTCITTNGFFLSEFSKELADCGLDEVHIHIPSLNPEKYARIMRGNSDLKKVLKAVESAIIYFKKVMINIPIEFGRNDDEIESFMEYFCKLGATPRFIESMSTKGYNAKKQGRLEDQISKRIKNIKKTGSYLWGIDTYEFDKFKFEILRCICFDNKCDICYKTNFIHLDKDFKIRPCNLRKKKIEVNSNNPKKSIIESIKFLSKQKCPPLEYNNLWNE